MICPIIRLKFINTDNGASNFQTLLKADMLICQRCVVVSVEARVAFEWIWLTELHAFENWVVLVAGWCADIEGCVAALKFHCHAAILI